MKICSVYDSASATFGRPFFVPTVSFATRAVLDELRAADSPLAKHPEDYILYLLGDFDDATGIFDCIGPEVVVRIDFLMEHGHAQE